MQEKQLIFLLAAIKAKTEGQVLNSRGVITQASRRSAGDRDGPCPRVDHSALARKVPRCLPKGGRAGNLSLKHNLMYVGLCYLESEMSACEACTMGACLGKKQVLPFSWCPVPGHSQMAVLMPPARCAGSSAVRTQRWVRPSDSHYLEKNSFSWL